MKIFEIKNKFNGKIIFSLKCKSFKICIEMAIKNNANLTGANLQNADLTGANLRGANLTGANLRGTNLQNANLRGTNLTGAGLRGANLRGTNLTGTNLRNANLTGTNLTGADLRGTNLTGANLDFSCWPLHCGSFNAKADDRLVSQLIHHIAKLNTDNCSGRVKESIEYIKKMAISDLFCEYRNDIKIIEE